MVTDGRTQEAVLEELSWEPSVNAAHIGVTARTGVVTLTGHVSTFAQKHAAESAARKVKGVRAVASDIEVRLEKESVRGDEEIAQAIIRFIDWDDTLPKDRIKVIVDKGAISLLGTVDWQFQRDSAEKGIRNLTGVVGVTNLLTIKPRSELKIRRDWVTRAIGRSWCVNGEKVKVRTKRGVITLSGYVHSAHDREVAANAAWAAPGTTSVINRLILRPVTTVSEPSGL